MKLILQKIIIINCAILISVNPALAAAKKKPSLEVSPSPSPSSAPKCTDVLGSCDKALNAKDKEIDQAKKTVDKFKDDNTDLTQTVNHDKKELNQPFRNPFLMLGLGAGAALVVGGPIVLGIGLLGGIILMAVTQ